VNSRSLAFGLEAVQQGIRFHVILNAYWEALPFELPCGNGILDPWRRWIDTALEPPCEIVKWEEAPVVSGEVYQAGGRSVVVLLSGSVFRDADGNREP